jgi:hypothetical protein
MYIFNQGRNGKFLAEKTATAVATSPVPPQSILQNLDKGYKKVEFGFQGIFGFIRYPTLNSKS